MLCHEIAALRLFLCAHAKNGALAAATANLGIPSDETDSDSDPLALDANADRKSSLEDVPA